MSDVQPQYYGIPSPSDVCEQQDLSKEEKTVCTHIHTYKTNDHVHIHVHAWNNMCMSLVEENNMWRTPWKQKHRVHLHCQVISLH